MRLPLAGTTGSIALSEADTLRGRHHHHGILDGVPHRCRAERAA